MIHLLWSEQHNNSKFNLLTELKMNLELFYCSQSEQLDNRSCKKELNAWHRQDRRKYFSTSCHTHTLSPLHCISIKSHIKYFGPKAPTPHPKNNPPYYKNSPIKGWGGLSKMSNKMSKMSIIELSWLGQDLFDFSSLTWAHPLTHPSTHR